MNKDEVDKLSKLARMNVSEEEKVKLTQDLTNILAYVGEIQEVVAELSEDMDAGNIRNVMREDADPHPQGMYSDEIIFEMPDKYGNYLKVKKIL